MLKFLYSRCLNHFDYLCEVEEQRKSDTIKWSREEENDKKFPILEKENLL